MAIIAMINARGGSLGIPRKNVKLLSGKPLIAYSIETGLEARGIDRVIVSTEDNEIADIALQFGAEVPFMRPKELATAESIQVDTIRFTVQQLEAMGENVDTIILLQPTAPLRSVEDVEGCLALFEKSEADTVLSVTPVDNGHPSEMYHMLDAQQLESYVTLDAAGANRQANRQLYWRTGSVYVMRAALVVQERAIFGKKVVGYTVPPERSFNLDTMFDWELTEAWMAHQNASG